MTHQKLKERVLPLKLAAFRNHSPLLTIFSRSTMITLNYLARRMRVANGNCETRRLAFFFVSPKHFDFLDSETPSSKSETSRHTYRIYSCISRPFTTQKSAQKIALDLYTSHTQRPDQAVREISIIIARSALGKPVIIVVDFHQFSEHSSPTKKCEIINVKWFKRRSTGDYFYCVF